MATTYIDNFNVMPKAPTRIKDFGKMKTASKHKEAHLTSYNSKYPIYDLSNKYSK